jgi:hypothetical protein
MLVLDIGTLENHENFRCQGRGNRATAGLNVPCTEEDQFGCRFLPFFSKGVNHGTGQSPKVRSTRILGGALRLALILPGLSSLFDRAPAMTYIIMIHPPPGSRGPARPSAHARSPLPARSRCPHGPCCSPIPRCRMPLTSHWASPTGPARLRLSRTPARPPPCTFPLPARPLLLAYPPAAAPAASLPAVPAPPPQPPDSPSIHGRTSPAHRHLH